MKTQACWASCARNLYTEINKTSKLSVTDGGWCKDWKKEEADGLHTECPHCNLQCSITTDVIRLHWPWLYGRSTMWPNCHFVNAVCTQYSSKYRQRKAPDLSVRFRSHRTKPGRCQQKELCSCVGQVAAWLHSFLNATLGRGERLRWSRGSVLPLSTQVRGFKPDRSRQDFSGRKNPQNAFLRRGSKAVGPMS